MSNDIEEDAKKIYEECPATYTPDGGEPQRVEWDNLDRQFPEHAEEYRRKARDEAARRRAGRS